jgi:hypothetical protein
VCPWREAAVAVSRAENWERTMVGRCKLKRIESRVESAWFPRLKVKYDN